MSITPLSSPIPIFELDGAPPDKVTIRPVSVNMDVPIFVCDLRLIADHLRLARIAIDELRVSHPESTPSNVKAVYMSPWRSHLLNDKLLPLCNSIVTLAKEASKHYLKANLVGLNVDLVVSDCWGIIYEQSDHTVLHNHFPADFSCAVYLEADEGCAPIVFSSCVPVQPRPCMAVIFPGFIPHEVPKTQGRRVVVGINLFKAATFALPTSAQV